MKNINNDAYFVLDIQDEVDELDAALDSDPKLFERILDDAIVTNGRDPDSIDLRITLDLTALCRAIELRAEKGESEASLFRKIAERGHAEVLLHPLLQTFMMWKHNLVLNSNES